MELDSEIWFYSNLQKEKKVSAFIIDETIIQIIGYDFVLNQYIVQDWESISRRKDTCLLLKNSLDL